MKYTQSHVTDREAGTVDLDVGVFLGTVSLETQDTPTRVRLTVETPDGSAMFATLEDFGLGQFDFSLSAEPDTTGFKLHYVCDF